MPDSVMRDGDMLKLEATLVATTAARPWRDGWSLDRGVDFIVQAASRQIQISAEKATVVAPETACFLQADDVLPPGAAVAWRFDSLTAEAADAAALERTDAPLTRAWSSVPRKAPGS